MPPAEGAVGERQVAVDHVTRLDEVRLAGRGHVVESDDGPRDHVADDDDDEHEQIFQHVAIAQ